MPVEVAIEGDVDLDPEVLVGPAGQVLAALGFAESELSILLCDDAVIRSLNQQWRGIDAPTDVLSFPQDDDLEPGEAPALLGDLVISVPTARRQADELGHELHVELLALLVHGALHLAGHDHEEPAEQARMIAMERRLHEALGLGAEVALVTRAG